MQTYNMNEDMKESGEWGVLFDLDGVLVDSEREYTRIWERIGRDFPTGYDDFAIRIKGTTLDNILSTYFPDPETRERVIARLYDEEARMVYAYCRGARELLEDLKANGIPVALFTSSNSYKMEHLYRDIPEIKDYFDEIVLGDRVSRSKPDPEGYLLAARRLGLPAGKWVVVEDSLQGVKAGKASGGRVLGVAGTLASDTLAPHCDFVVSSLEGMTAAKLRNLIINE